MKIDYFDINEDGCIGKYDIDTEDKEYVSHSDYLVFTQNQNWCGVKTGRIVPRDRKFEVVKQQLIQSLKEQLKKIEELTENDVDDYTSKEY